MQSTQANYYTKFSVNKQKSPGMEVRGLLELSGKRFISPAKDLHGDGSHNFSPLFYPAMLSREFR